jgi:hypothetical protein
MVHRLELVQDPTLPAGAWCLEVAPGSDVVRVQHGRAVEPVGDGFFFGAWDRPFGDDRFDRAAVRMGTGAVVRDGRLVLVPASHPYEAVHIARHRGCLLASNSLIFLLTATGATPRVDDSDYYWKLHRSHRAPRSLNPVRFEGATSTALVLDPHIVRSDVTIERVRSAPGPRFTGFDSYREQIVDILIRLSDNGLSRDRTHAYSLSATMSAGYDSAACAVLGREAGWRTAVTMVRETDEASDPDDGTAIGELLGYQVERVPADGWQSRQPFPEAEFAAGPGPQLSQYFANAEDQLQQSLLLTGAFGDTTWTPAVRELTRDFNRPRDFVSVSECMVEWQLRVGVVHIPVPMIGADDDEQFRRLSNSPEMAPWSIGGKYDRPIPRRLLEEQRVPRDAFATIKRPSPSIRVPHRLCEDSRLDYQAWLDAHRNRRRQVVRDLSVHLKSPGFRVFGPHRQTSDRAWELHHLLKDWHPTWKDGHVFHWAVEKVRGRYPGNSFDLPASRRLPTGR